MRMITLKANPKTIFGAIMAITGILVIVISFASTHNGVVPSNAKAEISCATVKERADYIASLGWQTDGNEASKEITIPNQFNQVYTDYNKIQTKQGFDLEKHKGKAATIYTYNITNYDGNENVIADLIVQDGILIGADLCDTNAQTGFLIALDENGQN